MTTALLQTTYFGPVQWYQKLNRYDRCIIEQYDNYQKQTYRNRCVIATANGLQALTVPVEASRQLGAADNGKCLVRDVRISDHNQWRRVHWNALQSAYSESPFFEYYADDLHPFFEQKYEFLTDFNEAIREKVCQLLDIHPKVVHSSQFSVVTTDKPAGSRNAPLKSAQSPQEGQQPVADDFREVISAKHPLPDPDFTPRSYWQVFQRRHGFLPNLSILDLLFNMGPESIFYL
jgi:hypothetical protein